MIDDIEFVAANILTPEKFSIEVERLYNIEEGRITLMDALMEKMLEYDIDYDNIMKLVSRTLYEKLHSEATEFNMLKEKDTTISLLSAN